MAQTKIATPAARRGSGLARRGLCPMGRIRGGEEKAGEM